MNTDEKVTSPTDDEIRAIGDKLTEWAAALTAREQWCLAALLADRAEAGPAEVEGYSLGYGFGLEDTLTNLIKMRHEMLKYVAENLRG
ncbi:MAG: hypothetical protein HYX51_08760 [Chloroflexi bacterium]|nr:hypothetical protein [Chloroflexota bacterium]